MRVRRVRIIVGVALVWAVVPLSASATGCEVDAGADVAVPGEKSTSMDGGCASIAATGSASFGDTHDGKKATHEVQVDADGDGGGDVGASGTTELYCPPPEEQSLVKSVVCPILQAT